MQNTSSASEDLGPPKFPMLRAAPQIHICQAAISRCDVPARATAGGTKTCASLVNIVERSCAAFDFASTGTPQRGSPYLDEVAIEPPVANLVDAESRMPSSLSLDKTAAFGPSFRRGTRDSDFH